MSFSNTYKFEQRRGEYFSSLSHILISVQPIGQIHVHDQWWNVEARY